MIDFNQFSIPINYSTILLFIPTLTAILIAYLQHKNLITSPFSQPKPSTKTKPNQIEKAKAKCENCLNEKPIQELKTCSRCKEISNLSIYFCNQSCQRSNWKSHKLNCGQLKNLLKVNENLPDGISSRDQLEHLLGNWCEFHRHLLIFSTIQALEIPKHPLNSLQNLFLISINFNPNQTNQTKEDEIHSRFSLDFFQVLHSKSFLEINPAMNSAFEEIDSIRFKIKQKGGTGVAMLLVRCGPVVQVIPVGLPSQNDLNSVKYEKDWKVQFENSIKAGIKLNPLPKPITQK
ncbi:uncharacterized protein MELLADRAFT_96392 [Melampsora larici-populina 98AG31]|uniref:MYND-type domain-containing protein n=1 Tax=Melampsora larici-populina (strain 98AG31 / pathotype 3-4-7) TaxID=747676 RepID=F4REM0_MELLP|nr:uncharacterized protein MELLADRAFT_96392 [Melampsora larici-populina 98AG31]EGG09121.1 hypothetical protein MELLADRAFT_96392 [Melampsora larici-populina 98AG31]